MKNSPHISVMLPEVMEALSPRDGEIYVDGTFGAGGYSRAVLAATQTARVFAIDRDPDAAQFAQALQQEFPDRFIFLLGTFSDMLALLASQNIHKIDGLMLDIGVSSMQLQQAERGFSFSHDGPLDMRMGDSGKNAADIIAQCSEKELADILYHYGEERASRRIARAIVAARQIAPITRTAQLADIVRRSMGTAKAGKIDAATRSFQALRIYVNNELEELHQVLLNAEKILRPQGRLVVVTFHSLEDRIVKEFIRVRAGHTRGASRHLPEISTSRGRNDLHDRMLPSFFAPYKKALRASETESRQNPRSRSASLRLAVRTDAPIWQEAE